MLDRVRLVVEGLMLEKLVNRALDGGACVTRLKRTGERTISIDTDTRGAEVFVELCKRFSIRYQMDDARGMNALKRAVKRRGTLAFGLAICAVMLYAALSRVWLIDVLPASERTEGFNAQELSAALDELGVYAGMSVKACDADAISMRLTASLPQYAYISASVKGVRLLIEAAPAIPEPELYALNNARDLIAACDGIVVSVDALTGTANAKPGDVVKRGDVLIRGEERITKEETRGVSALGEVLARVWYAAEASEALSYIDREHTGKSDSKKDVILFDYELPLADRERYACEETTVEYLPIGGLYLPLMIRRETANEYVSIVRERDIEALKAELANKAKANATAQALAELGEECLITGEWTDFYIDGETMSARSTLEVIRNIAVSRRTLIQGG